MLSRTLLLLCSIFAVANGAVKSSTEKIKEGKFTYYHDEDISSNCDTVFLMGVGTAMATTDYSIMSEEISKGQPVVTVITDHAPNFFVKLSSGGFAKLYNALTKDLGKLIPVCEGKSPKILVGAHSASGQASIEAMQKGKLDVTPDGYIGLDPFKISERKMKIDVPLLAFGFEKTTCKVTVNQAAKPAYKIAGKDHRVFYRIKNKTQKIQHCAFTNKGCSIICGAKPDGDWVRGVVAQSVHAFVKAIKSGNFSKGQFNIPVTGDAAYELFVGGDEP